MNTYYIHLCDVGWQLYDAYCLGSATWARYMAHRRKCAECSKPKGKR